jgi:hypothetical protein
MKTRFETCLLAGLFCARALIAQELPDSDSPRPRASLPDRGAARSRSGAGGDYSSDIAVVDDAQAEALKQARALLEETEAPLRREALQTAIKEMERSRKLLEAAKKTPSELPAAVASEQAAYQALLKIISHEKRVMRSRSGRSGGGAGQPSGQQIDQLEMTPEENRYEKERQATPPQTAQQKEQLEMADRLKQLAQRQQDLNDRLRDLQTALQEARTEQEREEIKRQIKHLTDDERQMLADVDELRQRMEQSPNASSMANARQQLDQARSDTQRAAQELQNQSPSQALAAGARAQQTMQNLREDLRHQTSGQFTDQMRQLRSQAREMAGREEEVGRGLESLSDPEHKSLDDSAPRQQLVQQMARQQSALTNLLSKMQDLTEQAETTEPLLSQQLYDAIRRANQMHTDSSLETSAQLLSRGFLSQAEGAERSARTNINELRQRVERAAESVLGNEADALRYAQKELDDLTSQVAREVAGGSSSNRLDSSRGQTNSLARGTGRSGPPGTTNLTSGANNPSGAGESQLADNDSQKGQSNSANGAQRGKDGQQASGASGSSDQAGQNPAEGQGRALGGQTGNQPGADQQQAANNAQAGQNPGQGQGRGAGGRTGNQPRNDQQQAANGGAAGESNEAADGSQQNSDGGDGGGGGNRLRDLVQQLGVNNNGSRGPGGGLGGPITGNDFVNWADRMRDVEQVLESPELRNQLATARERLAGFRADYRARGTRPDTNSLQIKVLGPMTEVRVRLQEDLARLQDSHSLVPLDHDPVPDNYTDLVRKYYEKLGGGQ